MDNCCRWRGAGTVACQSRPLNAHRHRHDFSKTPDRVLLKRLGRLVKSPACAAGTGMQWSLLKRPGRFSKTRPGVLLKPSRCRRRFHGRLRAWTICCIMFCMKPRNMFAGLSRLVGWLVGLAGLPGGLVAGLLRGRAVGACRVARRLACCVAGGLGDGWVSLVAMGAWLGEISEGWAVG